MATDHFPVNGQTITEDRMRRLVQACFGGSEVNSHLSPILGVIVDGMEVTYSGADISVSAGTFITDSGVVCENSSVATFSTTTDGAARSLWLDDTGSFGDNTTAGLSANHVKVCVYSRSGGSVTAVYYPSYGGGAANVGPSGGGFTISDRTATAASIIATKFPVSGPMRLTVMGKAQPSGAGDAVTVSVDHQFVSNAKEDGWGHTINRRSDGDGTNQSYESDYYTTDADPGSITVSPTGTNGVDTVLIADGIWWRPTGNQGAHTFDVDVTVSTTGTLYAGFGAFFETGQGPSAP